MEPFNLQVDMLSRVAVALDELVNEVVFVGGCVTGLLVNDPFTLEQVRFTDDVDLIVDVITHADWNHLQNKLRERGFKEDMMDKVICRMRYSGLKVDIMPIDEQILGFANQWYRSAIKSPVRYKLSEQLSVNIVSPVYFVATKIGAYLGRGNNDVLTSHDVEDVVTLFDGRPEIVGEINHAERHVCQYISDQLAELLKDPNFEYVVQSVSRSDIAREQIILERIKKCIKD